MRQGKLLSFLLPILFCFLTFPKTAFAETEILNVVKDTYANEAYPDKVNGSFGSVVVSNKFTTRLGYLAFEDFSLPENSVIDSAVLKIYLHELHYADTAKVNVGPVTQDWSEASLTWDNKPTINQSLATESTISLTESGWKEISVTQLVQKWSDGSLENNGLFIYPFGFLYGVAETEYAFSSKSRESGDNPAQIEIEYHLEEEATPTPEDTSPTPEATPGTDLASAEEASLSPTKQPSPTPTEEDKSATEEANAGALLSLTTGQTVVGGLIIFALIGAVIAFAVYFARQSKKPNTKKKPEVASEEEEEK